MSIEPADLLPGDALLYSPSSIFGRAIAWMTAGDISHIEIYKGGGISYASRDGVGVNEYPLRMDGLKEVRRSTRPLNMGAMAIAFSRLKGHKYDNSTILKFVTFGKLGGKTMAEVCSEAATILYRAAGLHRLFGDQQPDEITPRDFQKAEALRQIWFNP